MSVCDHEKCVLLRLTLKERSVGSKRKGLKMLHCSDCTQLQGTRLMFLQSQKWRLKNKKEQKQIKERFFSVSDENSCQ